MAESYNNAAVRRWSVTTTSIGGNLRSTQTQVAPHTVNALDNFGRHADGSAPVSLGLAGPLVGGVEAHFRAQTGDGRGEVEIVHGRGLGNHGVPCGVHSGADRPDDVRPVAGIDVVIHDYHQFRVGELAKVRPDTEHDTARVAGVLLADADHGDPVGAGFAGQVEVFDFGELGLEDGHEHIVECEAEDGGFIGGATGVRGVIDRVVAVSDAVHRHHREALRLVVVPGVVAEGAFHGGVARGDVSLHGDFGVGRHLEIRADALDQLRARAPHEAGEGVFRQRVGDRRDRRQDRGRIRTDADRDRKRLVRMAGAPRLVIRGAAPMRQPPHDDAVAVDHLLAVDADILPLADRLAGRAAGGGQSPGDQRSGVFGPTGLDRPGAQVDVIPLDDVLLAGAPASGLGSHLEHLLDQGQLLPDVAGASGRFRRAERGQQPPQLAEHVGGIRTQRGSDAAGGAEQIAQHMDVASGGAGKQQRGPLVLKCSSADFRYFQPRVHRDVDVPQLVASLEMVQERPEILIPGWNTCPHILPARCRNRSR